MDRRALLLGPLPAVVLVACGANTQTSSSRPSDPTALAPTSAVEQATESPPLEGPVTVSLSLYVMQDDQDPAGSPLSSQRSEADLSEIAQNMSGVWAQANLVFDPITIETVQVPADVLEAVALGLDTDPFFDQAGATFDIPNPSAVNGFYVRSAGGVNGFAPSNSRVFFVVDEPSVNDERVSSHEVGHIFGLHHQIEDPGTLMFSGTNGTVLCEDEIVVARYNAQGVLNGVR